MKGSKVLLRKLKLFVFLVLTTIMSFHVNGQNITINLSVLEGMDLTLANILNVQIQSTLTQNVNVIIDGEIRFRQAEHKIQYKCEAILRRGNNYIDAQNHHPIFTYSSTGLRELFTQYNTLPKGTYEYCVRVTPANNVGEIDLGQYFDECIYNTKQEDFFINLIEPENEAKIFEKNPTLTWIANSTISNQLLYKLRITEIKKGQSKENAIVRNNAIFTASQLSQNTLVYPFTAKPLELFQPYAWTVDAYYKNILLGSAEPWQFIIIEQTMDEVVPKEMSYIEVNLEKGVNTTLIAGLLKLKYIEKEKRSNTLKIIINDEQGKVIKGFNQSWKTLLGENRIEYRLDELDILKHKSMYYVNISDESGLNFQIKIKYFNPAFIK